MKNKMVETGEPLNETATISTEGSSLCILAEPRVGDHVQIGQ